MPSTTVPPELTYAPFTGAHAVAAGLLTRRQLTGTAWRRLFPNVYAWRGLPLDHRARCLAAALFVRGRGVISGRDAAALWGADILLRGAPTEVTVPSNVRFRGQPGLRVVRSAVPAADRGIQGGIALTTPARTAFDLARRLHLFDAVAGVDAMLAADLITESEIAHLAARRPGWPGIPQLRKVLLLCDAGAGSPQETRLRLILIGGGLPWPRTQYEVFDGGRFVARLDLAYPERRLGVEYDGDQHRSRAAFRDDVRRLNNLRACGWTVLRFVVADMRRPRRIVAVVTRALGALD